MGKVNVVTGTACLVFVTTIGLAAPANDANEISALAVSSVNQLAPVTVPASVSLPTKAVSPAQPIPKDIPKSWLDQVQKDIAQREYHITWQDKTDLPKNKSAWQAPNRAHDFRTYFTDDGLTVVPRSGAKDWLWSLKLIAYGDELTDTITKPKIKDNRIEYSHTAKLKEWYINNAQGLEQGFTLTAPANNNDSDQDQVHQKNNNQKIQIANNQNILKLAFQLGGSLTASLTNNNQTISLKDQNKQQRFTFGKLKVIDANNKTLKSFFELDQQTQILTLVTDASDAVYPITIDPVLSGATPFLESNQAGANFGFSVASAGDVNGDGYGDVIIGARFYDNGQTDEGAAFVYLGLSTGLTTIPGAVTDPSPVADWTAESNQDNAWFGASVASAGDVNGDGYGDVIVGASSYDNGQRFEGAAFVYLGSETGLTSTINTGTGPNPVADWTAESNQSNAQFGVSVASAGDVNGDGFGDVIVGASKYDNDEMNEGAVFVYLGSSTGLKIVTSAVAEPSPTVDWRAESNQGGSWFGSSVASAGDVNGDGFGDVIIGALNYKVAKKGEGAVFVYLGSSTGLSTILSSGAEPSPLADWFAKGNQGIVPFGGIQTSASFGVSVASAGDVNGDGYGDVIIGAYGYDNDQIDEGAAFVYLGSNSGLTSLVNSGSGPSPVADWAENNQTGRFGYSVASAGDVNGDGLSDVIVGAYGYSNSETSEGAAFVYLGSSTNVNSSAAWLVESNQAMALFGISVAGAGDVNGDGYGNVIIGAHLYDNGETDEGAAGVYDLTPPLAPFTPNGSYNITQRLVSSRTDNTTLIPACGLSDHGYSFKLQVIRNNAGAGSMLQLEWEVKANGQAFVDGDSSFGTAINASASGSATITEVVSGLQRNTAYRWRARVLENGVASPWLRVLNHDVQGCDIRTNTEADLALTVSAPNEVGVNREFDAVFNIANTTGPDPAPRVVFNTAYYPNTLPILSVVADNGGSCDIQNLLDQNQSIISSRASCTFPEILMGTTANVTLKLKDIQDPASFSPTSYSLGATVLNGGYDPNTTNNTVSKTVNILPALGLSVTKTAVTTAENDQIDYFTVQLTSPPDGNVSVRLSSNNGAEAQVFPTELTELSFDSNNWNLPLPVTVRGVRDDSDADTVTANYQITLTPISDTPGSTDDQQIGITGAVSIGGQNTNVPAITVTNTGLSIPVARAPGYGADLTGGDITLTWDKVVHPQGDPVSFNIYLCTESTLPNSCKQAVPVVQASLMPLWITAGTGGSGLLLLGFVATRPRKRWLVVAGIMAIGFTLGSCSSGGGSDLPPAAPPAPDTMSTIVTGLTAGTYYWRVEAFEPGDGGIPTVSSEVMIFTVSP